MRRLYKLIIIIIVSSVLTIIVFKTNKNNLNNILVFSDNYRYYNYYLKKYYKDKNILNNYRVYYKNNYDINTLYNDIYENKYVLNDKLYLKQIINKSNIVILDIGSEELGNINRLSIDRIRLYIDKYDNIVNLIKDNNNGNIVIIGINDNNIDKSNEIIINSYLKDIANKYNSVYVDITKLNTNKDIVNYIVNSI